MSFKVGEKCIFIGGKDLNKSMKLPKINEIVVIKSKCTVHENHYDLVGYERTSEGVAQSFCKSHLRKLDYNFVEEVISKIKQQPVTI